MYEYINNIDKRTTTCRVYFRIMHVHLGKMIDLVRKEKGMTKSELARRINKHRSTLEDILLRESLDTELVFTIGEVLDYDFFSDISKNQSKEVKKLEDTLTPIVKDDYKEKYYSAIERYGNIMEKYSELQEKYASLLEETKSVITNLPELKEQI